MSGVPARIVVVTPGLGGADGVSEVTRQFVDAFTPFALSGDAAVEVWSLADADRPEWLASPSIRFRTAAGRRAAFASFGLRAGDVDDTTLFVVMHVHLLPVMLPLLYRGARVAVLLLGIEAWKPLRRLSAKALRHCWRVLSISSHTIARFHDANPALADVRVQVCAPGVPPAAGRAAVLPEAVTTDAQRLPFALIVGRMASEERYKGHDELIDVWPRVRAEVPGARLVVAGGGDDEARLRARVGELGLDEAIQFAGRVPSEQLAALYRDARFFVMPSRNEGFGLVFLEAMRAGKPCIAALGAAEEILTDGVHGFVVDPAAQGDLLHALVRLFADDDVCARMGAAAAARVEERFTRGHFVDRVLESLDLRTATVAC